MAFGPLTPNKHKQLKVPFKKELVPVPVPSQNKERVPPPVPHLKKGTSSSSSSFSSSFQDHPSRVSNVVMSG